MIEIDENKFGYWPNASHAWFLSDETTETVMSILEQLYAQMMGWT